MGFGSFQLFTDVARNYVNFGAVAEVGRALDVGTALGEITSQVFGLPVGSTLSSVRNFLLGGCGFIVDTVTGERMIFQYNAIGKESGGAEYETQQVLGRSIPRLSYKGGKLRQLILPVTFTMNNITRQDVRVTMRWLQALAYPDYDGISETSLSPHPVVVVQGQLYARDTWVVADYGIDISPALDPITRLPHEVTVNLTLIEVANKAKSISEVIRL